MNNVEAAIVLLKNGANKDMQSNKVGLRPGPGLAGPSTWCHTFLLSMATLHPPA